MPSYRLLRSNKESGPYTLNDLVALGLKPYDLVWVDGRSAAWRYPSEVDELKEYAPAIEEQPYDRFYKRPSETELSIKEPVSVANSEKIYQPTTINESFAKEEPAKNIPIAIGIEKPVENKEVKTTIPEIRTPYQSPEPKKKVFVSMPETNGFEPYQNTSQDSRHDQQQYEQNQYQQYLPKPKPEQVKQKPIEERSYSPISVQESDESRLETKYTQSLDDIKEMYINTLVQRKTNNRRKEILKKLRPVLIPVLLLAAGFAIGYVIKTKKSPLQASQTVSTVVPPQTVPDQKKDSISTDNTDNKITHPEENQGLSSEQRNSVQPIDKPTTKTDNDKNKSSRDEQEQVTEQQQKQYKDAETELPKAVLTEKKKKESSAPDDEVASYQKKNVEVDPTTGERKKVVRDDDEITPSQNNSRNNTTSPGKRNKTEPNFIETDHKDLRDLVSVQSNNYIRGAFGGIRGLELTVSNNSDFLLDEVSVELQIMKPSEQPLRTDIITFKNVGSNKSITVKVPDSQRGIRVDYRITNIESKQWEKSTAGL
jgi:hypothetical protein